MPIGSITLSERLSGSFNVQEQEAAERIMQLESALRAILVFASVNTDRDVCLTIKKLAEAGLEE
jgi:fatty acid-binding protein DegV